MPPPFPLPDVLSIASVIDARLALAQAEYWASLVSDPGPVPEAITTHMQPATKVVGPAITSEVEAVSCIVGPWITFHGLPDALTPLNPMILPILWSPTSLKLGAV